MKKVYLSALHLLFILLFFSAGLQQAAASHAMGADLTYECLGNNQYRLRFSFYRDCAGINAPATMSINFSNSCGLVMNTVYLNPTPNSPTLITPVCPTALTTCDGGTYTGIQEWIYEGVVTLPGPCADWTFSHSENARNSAISTISGAGIDDLYVYTQLDNTNGLCNNSPTFSNRPVPFACVGQRFCFNHGAFDADGDSLAYQLITPLNGPGSPVTYLPGYSATQPVLSNPPVTFDPATGDICMTPTQAEVTVFAVLVNEYRNGVLIGQVERDIQLTVNQCSNNLPSLTGMDGAPMFSKTVCADEQLCFYIASIDPDASNTTTITWDGNIAGATFTNTGGHRDSALFCWTPSQAEISLTPYCFTATVTDDNCPYQGIQVYSYCITVQGVNADAGPDQTINCNTTTTLNANATGGNGTFSYTWDPGGIPGQSLPNVGLGTYIVHVTSGTCTNSDTVEILPGAGVPAAAFSFTNNCSGAPVQFTDQSVVGGGSVAAWYWDFGDGSTDLSQNPTHQYASNGTYDVTLIVSTLTGCTDTIVQQLTVNTNIPAAQFAAPAVCDGGTMNFTDQSGGGPITNWSWDFGDPGSGASNASTDQNPQHVFSGAGNYTVTLEVTNSAGCTHQVQQNVTVNSNPTPVVADQTICEGASATLDGTAGYATYSWDTGDNTQTITVSPIVTTNYQLTVTDNNSCLGTDQVTVTVNPLPVADAGSDQTICEGTNANLGGNGGVQFMWNPGNISGQNITVTPSATTDYEVTVTDANGCTDTDIMTVNVNPMPTVSAGSDEGICRGQSMTLNAVSSAGNFLWTPGNFNTPSITVSPGVTTTYILQVSDAIGCAGSDTVTITVNPIPVAAFANTGPQCLNNPIDFTDNSNVSSGSIASWQWSFGDSQTSNTQSPSYTYTNPGLYNVELIAISAAGCRDTVNDQVLVHALPVADAGPDQGICPGFNATLNGSGGINFEWTPGNVQTASITVSPSSTTDYTLLVTDANGCQNTDVARVEVHPVPVPDAGADINICFGESTTLTANGGDTYLWTPGNVNGQSYNVNPAVTSTYTVQATNVFGCQASDQITVQVNPLPVAAFASSGPVCQYSTVSYTDQSTVTSGTVTGWEWNFGNNSTGTVQNPSLPYNDPGFYNVNLIVTTDYGCKDTTNMQQEIWATPQASWTSIDVCDGNPVVFANNSMISDGTPLNYTWDLGDNTITSTTAPTHLYSTQGTYPASLIVTSMNGCADTLMQAVNVFALPVADFATAYVCEGQPASFIDQTTIASGNVSNWYWTFGDTQSSTESNPQHTYAVAGNYPISLLVTSNHGCQDSTTGNIRIIPNPLVDFVTENACLGFTVNLSDLSAPVTGSIVQYQWEFGDGSSSSDQNPVHMYTQSGWFQVSLTATTDSGCVTTLVRPNAVNIYPTPVSQFLSNASEANDIYPLVNFVNQTTSPGQYFWDFGDGNTSNEYSPTHLYDEIGLYNVQLITVDNNGCVDTTMSLIEIRPNSNLFIPNAFTPNGDLTNDIFRVYTHNIADMEVQIYDRWGLKIAEWKGLTGGWDGRIDGNPAQADTYVYRVSTIDVNRKTDVHIGHLSLVR